MDVNFNRTWKEYKYNVLFLKKETHLLNFFSFNAQNNLSLFFHVKTLLKQWC